MTPKTESGSFTTDAASSPSQSGVIVSKRHFDTFETQFFQQGDAENAGLAGEAERFDDLDESARRKRFVPSRQFMMGVAAGSTVIAIIGCIALWRSSNANARAAASVALAPPAQAEPVAMNPAAVVPSEPPAPANPAAVAVPTQAETVPAVALLPAPAPAQPAPAAAEAVPAAPTPPAPAQPPVPVVAEKPLAVAAEPVLAKPAVAAVEKPLPVEPAVAAVATEAQDRCKKAISDKRNKEILATCPDAFAADPSAADIAVALAKIEFDRGKSTQAASWGQKAIAADPNAADAYVFIGGAEQNAGHRKAAKEAYKRYLQLAPGGRYAADLRAIVGSL